MRDKVLQFIKKNNLSVFGKTNIRSSSQNIFKTRDAREIHQRTLNLVSRNFQLEDTKNLIKLFEFTNSLEEIKKRQEFFARLEPLGNIFLSKLRKRIPSWKPLYDSVVVTEDESTLIKLKERGCSVVFVNQSSDIPNLDKYDLVHYIDCENFDNLLERIPQAIPLSNLEEASLEKHLIQLSSWKENIEILKTFENTNQIKDILSELDSLLVLLDSEDKQVLDILDVELEL
jgi:hypothetical protein